MANDPMVGAGDERRAMMAALAQANPRELEDGLSAAGLALESARVVRPPETGLVMIRGRQGGTGAPFNLGEATVTRATVQLPDGTLGQSCMLGRQPEKAQMAAVVDAYWQQTEHRACVEIHILKPIRTRLAGETARKRQQTVATAVDFFTMVRGDD